MVNYREGVHKYIVSATILKSFYDDGGITKAEYYYFEEKLRFKYGIPEKSVLRIYVD